MQSYPDTNASAGDGAPPYYSPASSQQAAGLPNQDDIQLTAQLTRSLAPLMNAAAGGNMTEAQEHRDHAVANHHYEHEPELNVHNQHIQGGHAPMDQMGLQYATADGSPTPRKRSKVSRACDECRRKKSKTSELNLRAPSYVWQD